VFLRADFITSANLAIATDATAHDLALNRISRVRSAGKLFISFKRLRIAVSNQVICILHRATAARAHDFAFSKIPRV
jgi:hypothetical protein